MFKPNKYRHLKKTTKKERTQARLMGEFIIGVMKEKIEDKAKAKDLQSTEE